VYQTQATYDLAGNLASLTYPDGREITQGLDNAGHLQSVTYDNLNGTHVGYEYLTSAGYWPNGALETLFFGNGMVSGYHFNNRLQNDEVGHILLSPSVSNYSVKLYCFGVATAPLTSSFPTCDQLNSGNSNNGNVRQIKDVENPSNLQTFSYDNLNRITSASFAGGSEQYNIDSFGNMSVTGDGLSFTPSFDPASNRINNLPCASTGSTYDAAGNQLCDTDSNGAFRRYTYDGEGHISQIAVFESASPFETYNYDADGNRLRKTNADGTYTEYLNFNGQIIAEHNSDGSWNDYIFANGRRIAQSVSTGNPLDASATTTFYHTGRLGSIDVVTNGSGALLSTSQFLPFGLEQPSGTSTNHYKFTGKERDTESGLDYFGARYYGSSMGRFMSPDPSRLSINPKNPQTWNRYSYVYNNPLGLKDDNGKWPTAIHNQIIDNAFPNLSPAQRQILKNVSADQDNVFYGGQANSSAYQHAMSSPDQTVDQAQAQYTDFVSGEESAAQNAQMQFWMADPDNKLDNLSQASLEDFGKALHAVLDSTSPAHAGFQKWNWMNPFAVYRHVQAEKTITPQQMQNAVNAARNAYNATYGYLIGNMDNSTVTTSQGSATPCGGDTGHPCQ
jgi:RHS repeat-associated protein